MFSGRGPRYGLVGRRRAAQHWSARTNPIACPILWCCRHLGGLRSGTLMTAAPGDFVRSPKDTRIHIYHLDGRLPRCRTGGQMQQRVGNHFHVSGEICACAGMTRHGTARRSAPDGWSQRSPGCWRSLSRPVATLNPAHPEFELTDGRDAFGRRTGMRRGGLSMIFTIRYRQSRGR